MTDEAKRDLLSVMDQLAECRERHGMRHVSMFITADGHGHAWECSNRLTGDDDVAKRYEPAGGNRTGP